ncbi:branched-chain amino acid ABC transporter permease [Aureimonas fodinaquatilis]|uniref:Branched-chain amino acid ABC transporter permease n=1 Tax=Aureimonas fodinaquatilis TaxID=2565783 RepID=A0A5B0DZ91_9HYPH|nr:branched-chain amino acid ABC transporter permease [Aureimonas fodinaquatilis]KAA0971756.1 branched-chain amino acid ABC transporter permease [Aureimonas fodinaquatilis]
MEQALVNGLVLSMNYGLIALGLTMIFSLMNVLNFAHGQMYVLGGFVTYFALNSLGVPYFAAVLLAVFALAAVGLLFEYALFRPVRKRSTREESSMLLAAGTALLLESLILLFFGEKQRGVPAVVSGVFEVGGAFIPASRVLVFCVSLIAIIAFMLFMRYTRPGRALRAIAQDREVTALQGVNIQRYSALGFMIGAGLAGLAGALLITVLSVNSGMGTSISIKAFIMVMLGGAGVIPGAIIGAFVLGFAEAFGYAFMPSSMTYLLIFIGLILFLIIRPQGVMGKPWG